MSIDHPDQPAGRLGGGSRKALLSASGAPSWARPSETAARADRLAGDALTPRQYDLIRQAVYERSRIYLGSSKTELVARRVRQRMRTLRFESYAAYCDFLQSKGGKSELAEMLDAISTHVTDFFREPEHFRILREIVLPRWEARAKAAAGPASLRVWSAGCASGEEAYSLAMTLADFFRDKAPRRWQVEASDLSRRMIAQGERGIYARERVRAPAAEWLSRHFQRGVGEREGFYRVKRELRERIRFFEMNLFQAAYDLAPGLDVIFCRNVMIYFDRRGQEELAERLAAHLRPGGYLFIGHSESLIGMRHSLIRVQPSVYQRAEMAEARR